MATAGKKQASKILVTDDMALGAESEKRSKAVKQVAGRLAARLEKGVDLVHVEDLALYPTQNTHYKPLIESYFKEQRRQLGDGVSSLAVPAKAIFLMGEPASTLLKLTSKKNAYELIVLGTHGRKGIRRLVLGSVSEEVIRNAVIPVVTIGPNAQEESATFLSSAGVRILVPTSLTPNSVRAEAYAVALAKRLGGEVVFFHSMLEGLHPVMQTAFVGSSTTPQIRRFMDEVKAKSFKHLQARVKKAQKAGVSASAVIEDQSLSSADSILAESAKSKASLIVMGTHGRSLMKGAFLGRTARDVILEARVPVVTVRSRSK